MILVVTGTHHQPFDRLLRAANDVGRELGELVVAQVGPSALALPHCVIHRSFAPDELDRRMTEARVVVIHAGTSSFLAARALGRRPIVVPRRRAFGEQVDDHQVDFRASLLPGEAVVAEPETLLAAVRSFTEQRPAWVDPDHRSRVFASRLEGMVQQLFLSGREPIPP
jgi:UDP-N-acetylglucosamine transferase subunit ALG13